MKWIITGAAGFIGCHATARFLQNLYEVVAVDNLNRPGSAANLAWLESLGLKKFVEADVRDQRAMHRLLHDHSDADVVLHLAAQVAVTTSIEKPRLDFNVNARGTFNILEAVRKSAGGGPAVLYSSTNKVYGALERHRPIEEKTRYTLETRPFGIDEEEPLDFHSPYGCSKGAADQYVRDYARVYGLRAATFRQSCIYGTRQFGVEDQGWIAWFCIAAVTGQPITIFGDGKQVRDALWVDDLVDLYVSALEAMNTVQGQALNVGGGPANTISVLELVAWLEKSLGRSLDVRYADARQGDQKVFVASLNKTQHLCNWKPKVLIEEGLGRLLSWVEKNRELFERPAASLPPREVLSAGGGRN